MPEKRVTTPLSPGDLLSRYSTLGPYPTTAFPTLPNANKRRKDIEIISFKPRNGRSQGDSGRQQATCQSRSSTTAREAIEATCADNRGRMGINANAQTAYLRKKANSRVKRYCGDASCGRGGEEYPKAAGVYASQHPYHREVMHMWPARRNAEIRGLGRQDQALSVKRVAFVKPADCLSTPSSLLELYLDDKVNEHPAETERQVRAGAAGVPCSPAAGAHARISSGVDALVDAHLCAKSDIVDVSKSSSGVVGVQQEDDQEQVEQHEQPQQTSRDTEVLWRIGRLLVDLQLYEILAVLWQFVAHPAKRERVLHVFWLSAKLFVLLYLASCAWNIVAAIRDAIVKSLEPILAMIRLFKHSVGRIR